MAKQEQNSYSIEKSDATRDRAGEIEAALRDGDADAIQKVLQNPEAVHGLVLRIGAKGRNLELLEQSFNFLLKTRFGAGAELSEFESSKGPELIGFIREVGLPEQILTEISECAFHAGEDKKFFKILKFIYLNQEHFQNQQVVARAIHDMASWQGTHQHKETAISLNQEALGMARKTGDVILERKVQAGLSINKTLPPRLRAEDLVKIATELELKEKGVDYDAVRLRIEAAGALLELAKRQTGSLREENLIKAKNLALEQGLKGVMEIDYPKAEILARRILTDIYEELGDKKKSTSYAAGAKARQRFIKGMDS
jgi:hypothetical protein